MGMLEWKNISIFASSIIHWCLGLQKNCLASKELFNKFNSNPEQTRLHFYKIRKEDIGGEVRCFVRGWVTGGNSLLDMVMTAPLPPCVTAPSSLAVRDGTRSLFLQNSRHH